MLSLLTAVAFCSFSSQANDVIRQRIESFRVAHKVPGLWVAASYQGKPIFSAGLGSKWSQGDPAVLTDVLPIGSISKYFTADLACLLMAEKTLSGNTTVNQTFPEAVSKPCFRASVGQILHHRSGFPRDHIPWLTTPENADARAAWRRNQLMSFAKGEALDRRGYQAPNDGTNPDEREEYSNFAYSVLGAMMEKASKKPLEALFKEKIFGPFGLNSAGFGLPNPTGKDSTLPLGHFEQASDGSWKPFQNWYGNAEPRSMVATASGGVHMTVLDLCRYVTWRCLGKTASNAPYPKATMARLWRDEEKIDTGSGAIGGYRSWYRLDRQQQVVVVYIANANLTNDQTKELESYLGSL